jgi:S1-C subfamily serine protease
MAYRRLRIPVWLVALALVSTFVVGSSARPAVRPDVQPALRIVAPSVSEVITEDMTPQLAESLNIGCAQGVVVSHVMPSPLNPGDVILAINGNPVRSQSDLNAQLAKVAYGQSFTLEVYRDGGTGTVTVQRAMDTAVLPGTAAIRGISVAGLSAGNGVMVAQVQIGTAASALGLKSGDVILDVNGQAVHTTDEFVQYMRQLNNQAATFNVRQSNGHVNVFVVSS